MRFKILKRDSIEGCAAAAAMSYGKDIRKMSSEEKCAYTMRIWDKHTNVSEHFTQRVEMRGVPRVVSMLMEFQRDGITFTEFSQRRRVPAVVNEEYRRMVADGVKLEDARKCLSILTPSDFVATMNREAARNIVRILARYALFSPVAIDKITEFLAASFYFEPDTVPPHACPKWDGFIVSDIKDPSARIGDGPYEMEWIVPMYSLHEMIRHRKLDLISWGFLVDSPYTSFGDVTENTMAVVRARSFEWEGFLETRAQPGVQKPLRSLAITMRSLTRDTPSIPENPTCQCQTIQ